MDPVTSPAEAMRGRLHIALRGAVQGVGFRPFVYRLATGMGLTGWVTNSPQGVFIEVEGECDRLDEFYTRLDKDKPGRACIQSSESRLLDPAGYSSFTIRKSDTTGEISALVLPDIAVCPDCLRELFDPTARRYRYPFTNCTHCGPRFTIITALPYDRPNTSMASFPLCDDCRHEYEDPLDRRFHAQPIACPVCGPHLTLLDAAGSPRSERDEALHETVDGIRSGNILAVKGLGGFHLIADARNDDAVRLLRARKHREEKPLALMYPDLEAVRKDCTITGAEERLLRSPESPIVLLHRRGAAAQHPQSISPSVAPGNPYLGVMLPYTPLHHLLLHDLGFPVVATSGNLSDEPICTDEKDAVVRLSGIADGFLIHNRPIIRHCDDSIVRIVMNRELILRRARGYAPLPVSVSGGPSKHILALGGHLKNTVSYSCGSNVFLSQHIGDLETKESFEAFKQVIGDMISLYQADPDLVVTDLHPGYLSTQYAGELGLPTLTVQHHVAHVAACIAENELKGSVLGVAWDGTGYGTDGSVWGGEFFLANIETYRRTATFRSFRLPGNERAVKEPRRSALGMLWEMYCRDLPNNLPPVPSGSFTPHELVILCRMLDRGINAPNTTSAGRIFDAVASLLGLRHRTVYEGQAAMELEYAASGSNGDAVYHFSHRSIVLPGGNDEILEIDWEPMVRGIIADRDAGVPTGTIARKFHFTMVETIVAMAQHHRQEQVALSGGCFQNALLLERTIERLREKGFRPYWHQRIPPNDGGISAGQVAVAIQILQRGGNTGDRADVARHEEAAETTIMTKKTKEHADVSGHTR